MAGALCSCCRGPGFDPWQGVQIIPLLTAESEEDLKNPLMRVKEESEKAGFKLNIKKTKIMGPSSITSWQRGKSGRSHRFYLLGLQNHCGW